MGVILDTSVLVAVERGTFEPQALITGREQEPFGISTITAAELLRGVHLAATPKRRLWRAAYVEKVLQDYAVYSFDLAAAKVHADVWSRLRRRGIQIGAHDLMIAATAISLGFSVATLNRTEYERVDGLRLEAL